jgi:hypothetical protein
MSQSGSGDQEHHRRDGFPRMPHEHGQQEHSVGEADAVAGARHALVAPFDHASDGAVDSELLPKAQRRLAFEPDAPPNVEGVRIIVLPGQPGCEGPEFAAAEVGASDVADGNSGTPAASRDETLQVWLNDARDDGAWREATVQEMREGEHSYSPEETALIARGTALLGTFATGKGKARPMRHSKTVKIAETKHDEKSGLLIGHVEAEVCTSPEQVVAFLMHFDSKFFRSIEWNPEVDVRREVLEVRNPLHTVIFLEKKPAPFQNRTWLSSLLWQKVSNTPPTYIWVAVPIEHHGKISLEDEAHAIRAEGVRCIRATQTAPGVTRIEYACSLDLKGHLPRWLTDRLVIPTLMRLPYDLQTYFTHVMPPPSCTAANGTLLGHMIVDTAEAAKKPERASAVRTFVEHTAILRESGVASLGALVSATLGASGHDVRPQAVATPTPGALTVAEATTIGRGFDAIIRVSATPSDAVDALLQTYPAVNVATQQHDWLRPMLETIAKRRLATQTLGVKLRLAVGRCADSRYVPRRAEPPRGCTARHDCHEPGGSGACCHPPKRAFGLACAFVGALHRILAAKAGDRRHPRRRRRRACRRCPDGPAR